MKKKMSRIKSPAVRPICGSFFPLKTELFTSVLTVILIVKGIVAVIAALFDKRTPQEICGAHIDFLEKTPLKEQISTDRFHGMQTVIRKIQDYSTSLTQM